MWLVLVVVAGIIAGRFFSFTMPDNLPFILLSVLIFSAGYTVGEEENVLKKIKTNIFKILWLSTLTILGTFFGAFLISFFIPISAKESILASAGFGWYSLSGIMISNMYSPYLGSISFVANVFRESFAIILIPIVSKISSYGAISIGGSPSMDTLLGIIAKSNDKETTLISFGHGVILSTLIPFIIPALFYMFFK